MKVLKHIGLLCVTMGLMTGWAGAASVGKPVVIPDAMVSVTVSDLHGFIDGVGGVAGQVSPMASGAMLKNMLGAQLNDPGLSGIAPGNGLAIVVMNETNMFALVEVAEAQAVTYTTALALKGMQSKYTDGILVVAQNAAQLAQGGALAGAVKSSLLAKRSPTLRIAAQPASLCAKNQAQIDGMLSQMTVLMGMQMMQAPGTDPASIENSMRILEGEVRLLLSLAKQCDRAEIVLAPMNGSLMISETFVPLADSRLAKLINAPAVSSSDPKIQAGLLGDAAIALDFSILNTDAATAFMMDELDVLIKDMDLEVGSLAAWKETMTKWMSLYAGSCSETVDFDSDNFLSVNYALQVEDAAEVMEMFKTMETDMAPFLKFYESMGMPMTMDFKENARTYKEIDIHQFKVDITMPEEQQAAMAGINLSNMVYDVAICDEVMLYAMGGTEIERLIDRVKDAEFKAEPLKARSVYPANGFYYCDMDIAKYIEGIATIMPKDPNNPLPQMAAMLQGADPVTSAGFCEDGAVMWSVNLPGSLLAKIGQAVMLMQMQQIQQQQIQQSMAPIGTPGNMPAGLEPATMP